MRIISGKFKGKKLHSKKNSKVRPTTDRVKEAIFNIIQGTISNTVVIDLFAGFGSLGLEALSRGANKVYFVEKMKSNSQIIKKNIKSCNMENHSEVFTTDVFDFLTHTKIKADIIFMDPPYDRGYLNKSITSIIKNQIIKKPGLIIVEHSLKEKAPDYTKLEIVRERKYGNTQVTIYYNKEET